MGGFYSHVAEMAALRFFLPKLGYFQVFAFSLDSLKLAGSRLRATGWQLAGSAYPGDSPGGQIRENFGH
jgi:hypothetical protein